jgi:hypothetical protein
MQSAATKSVTLNTCLRSTNYYKLLPNEDESAEDIEEAKLRFAKASDVAGTLFSSSAIC